MENITSFTPPYHYLSSYYMESPIVVDNILFSSVHQAFYAKMTKDRSIKIKLARLTRPEDIRKLGESLIRAKHTEEWQLKTMAHLTRIKFENYPFLMKELKNTKPLKLENRLVYPDLIFGKYQDEGFDGLAKILMKIRDK